MLESIKTIYKPDILDCIASLSHDEVFTPPAVARKMLDLLPESVWSDPALTFLDPGCKTGVFLREAAKRLLVGLESAIPDIEERRQHIFSRMLFGMAITELTALISRRTLYYSKDASSCHAVIPMESAVGGVQFEKTQHTFNGRGACVYCGMSEAAVASGTGENYAYKFIHTSDPSSMKFDVIIGNPPYQLEDGGFKASARPIYQHFVDMARRANPRYVSLVIPSRWFAGGKGLDQFRKSMLADQQIRKIVDYSDASELFPGVDIAGGVCYFLWERDSVGPCEITNVHFGRQSKSKRSLDEFETLVRHSELASVIRKVRSLQEDSLVSKVSSRKPFGLDTKATPQAKGSLTLIHRSGSGKFPRNGVARGQEKIDRWQVMLSYVSYDHGGLPNKRGERRVFGRIGLLPPGSICNETYLTVGNFETEEQARRMLTYLRTKFVRALVSTLSFSHHITKDRFQHVPDIELDRHWSDESLYDRYKLSDAEVDFIETHIKEMP